MSSTTTVSASPFRRLFVSLFNMETYFARRAAFRQTYRELSQLSERELYDLGISRADLRSVALEATRQIVK